MFSIIFGLFLTIAARNVFGAYQASLSFNGSTGGNTVVTQVSTIQMSCVGRRDGGAIAGDHFVWEKKQDPDNYVKVASTYITGVAPAFLLTYVVTIGSGTEPGTAISNLTIRHVSLREEGTYRCGYPENYTGISYSNEINVKVVGFAYAFLHSGAAEINGEWSYSYETLTNTTCKGEFYGDAATGDVQLLYGGADISSTFSKSKNTLLVGFTEGVKSSVRSVSLTSMFMPPSLQGTQLVCNVLNASGHVVDVSTQVVFKARQPSFSCETISPDNNVDGHPTLAIQCEAKEYTWTASSRTTWGFAAQSSNGTSFNVTLLEGESQYGRQAVRQGLHSILNIAIVSQNNAEYQDYIVSLLQNDFLVTSTTHDLDEVLGENLDRCQSTSLHGVIIQRQDVRL